jgi:hypothetical protein
MFVGCDARDFFLLLLAQTINGYSA